ncbi:MAG: response regulator [Christensenellaceae bacterium]|nr:response regulator [Christensenellaceae bacterium]
MAKKEAATNDIGQLQAEVAGLKAFIKGQERSALFANEFLNNTSDIVAILDVDLKIVNCSAKFIDAVGAASPADILGKAFVSEIAFADTKKSAEQVSEFIKTSLSSGKPSFFRVRGGFIENAVPRDYSVSCIPTKLPSNGKTTGIIIIFSDITSIETARREAEDNSRAKSSFLANMSHEIRTPLNAVIGMTQIAKSSKDITRKEYCLDKIQEASLHLLNIINDILDISKIEADKIELSNAPFSLENLLQKVADLSQIKADIKHQTLIVNFDDKCPAHLIGDEQRISQVVTNLLSNAVKFTTQNGVVKLLVSLVSKQKEGDRCRIKFEIEDSGIGMSQDQIGKLFQAFAQADTSISRRFGGAGLGLTISQHLAQIMNGSITVESQLGVGSRFTFECELQEDLQYSKDKAQKVCDLSKVKILAVDDSEDVRLYFEDRGDKLGFNCITADSGEQALEIIEQEESSRPFDLIFLDWRMPGMSGVELARQIYNKYGSNITIIMISAYEWGEIAEEAKAAGITDFLPKPLFTSSLIDCIAQHFSPEAAAVEELEISEKIVTEYSDNCFAGKRVLLAEDIEINREIAASLLADTGIEIDNAENGVLCYDMFLMNPDKYDLILMDIHMPYRDGYMTTKMLRAIKSIPKAKTIPIIAMTANVFKEDVDRCLAAGMNDHIGKPIDVGELLYKLKKYLL